MCCNIVSTCPCDNFRANVENAEYADVIDSIEQIISSEYDGVITGGEKLRYRFSTLIIISFSTCYKIAQV